MDEDFLETLSRMFRPRPSEETVDVRARASQLLPDIIAGADPTGGLGAEALGIPVDDGSIPVQMLAGMLTPLPGGNKVRAMGQAARRGLEMIDRVAPEPLRRFINFITGESRRADRLDEMQLDEFAVEIARQRARDAGRLVSPNEAMTIRRAFEGIDEPASIQEFIELSDRLFPARQRDIIPTRDIWP